MYEKSAAQESLRKFTHQLKNLQGKTLGAGPWQYTIQLDGRFVVFYGRQHIEAKSKEKISATLAALLTTKSLKGSRKL